MSYTPTEWKAGDTVTSAKLNKIEQGISNNSSNVLMVEMEEISFGYQSILDATEIAAAFIAGKNVIVHFPQHRGFPDCYTQLACYAPDTDEDFIPFFAFTSQTCGTPNGFDLISQLNSLFVDQQTGKLTIYYSD